MFMPFDKLFSNVELPKAIIQSETLNIYEAVFSDVHHPFCIIEFPVYSQDIYLKMSSSVNKYNKLDNPNLMKIFYWSCEFLLKGNDKIYKFYFVTDHFEKDVKSWLYERNASKMFLFERDMYKVARDVASALEYAESFNFQLNDIKRESFLVSNNKIKYIPHTFLSEITNEISKCRQSLRKNNEVNNSIGILKSKNSNNVQLTTEDITKILIETNSTKEINNELNDNKNNNQFIIKNKKNLKLSKEKFDRKEQSASNSPIKTSKTKPILLSPNNSSQAKVKIKNDLKAVEFTYEEEKIEKESRLSIKKRESSSVSSFSPKKDININTNTDRVYLFGCLLITIAILYDKDEDNYSELITNDNFLQIEKRYGKEFLKLIRRTVGKEPSDSRKMSFQEVLEEIQALIKLKGTDEISSSLDKKRKNPNSLIQTTGLIERHVRFLHCFPELYQKMLFVNIQDKNQTFYEIQDLNVDFIIPVEHRTISMVYKENTYIFLLGGKNTNNVYKYDSDKRVLDQKENMLCNLERRSFGVCTMKNLIYVGGGYLDNEITKSCECFDIETNYWSKIGTLNEACTDLSLCPFNDKFIFKFGGQLQTLTLCQTIEKFDSNKGRWAKIEYSIEKGINDSFAFLRNSLSAQINDHEIVILGGINIYYEGSNKCYSFKITEVETQKKENPSNNLLGLIKEKKKEFEIKYEICNMNAAILPTKDPLELCTPCVFDDEVYVLQFKKNNHRKVIALSNEWKEIKDIKW